MTLERDKEETAVIFRKYPNINGGDVIALFPELPGDMYIDTCASFVHTGQHSAASVRGCIDATRAARPNEYADLAKELESAPYGYRLKICQRVTRAMNQARREALRK